MLEEETGGIGTADFADGADEGVGGADAPAGMLAGASRLDRSCKLRGTWMLSRRVDVVLFDKARGVGGRLTVRRRDPFAFDHGAQYFTVRDERFASLVRQWRAEGVAALWNGRLVVIGDGPARASESIVRYVGTPGMNAVAKQLASGLTVRTDTRIDRLERAGAGWMLWAGEGVPPERFDAVVVAAPAPQAAALLPDGLLGHAAANAVLNPCWAVMLGFDRPLEAPFDGAFLHGSPLSWAARNNSKPGRGAAESWVLHASPGWSAQNVERTPAEVLPELTAEFFRVTGLRAETPAVAEAHRWRHAHTSAAVPGGFLSEPGLVACGDWCAGGRVEGAYLSGLSAGAYLVSNR